MGVRESILGFAHEQTEAASKAKDQVECQIALDDMYFEPSTIGSTILRHACGLREDVSRGVELILTNLFSKQAESGDN